jgi:hypothetical protein
MSAHAVPATASPTRGARVGRALIIIGGVLVALSSWLNWGAKTQQLGPARTAYTIPAKFVIDNKVKVPGPGLSLGIVVLVLGLLVIAGAFSPWWKIVGLVLGVAVAVVALLYAYQVRSVIHDNNVGISVRKAISIGAYLAGIGGVLAAVGGVIALIPPGFWSSLTSEETSEEDEGKPAGAGGAP